MKETNWGFILFLVLPFSMKMNFSIRASWPILRKQTEIRKPNHSVFVWQLHLIFQAQFELMVDKNIYIRIKLMTHRWICYRKPFMVGCTVKYMEKFKAKYWYFGLINVKKNHIKWRTLNIMNDFEINTTIWYQAINQLILNNTQSSKSNLKAWLCHSRIACVNLCVNLLVKVVCACVCVCCWPNRNETIIVFTGTVRNQLSPIPAVQQPFALVVAPYTRCLSDVQTCDSMQLSLSMVPSFTLAAIGVARPQCQVVFRVVNSYDLKCVCVCVPSPFGIHLQHRTKRPTICHRQTLGMQLGKSQCNALWIGGPRLGGTLGLGPYCQLSVQLPRRMH